MKNQEDNFHDLQILHDYKHHKLGFHLFCFSPKELFVMFNFPSLTFLKKLFHCEYHCVFNFISTNYYKLHETVFRLILVELQSYCYFQFQIMVLNLNMFVYIDFILALSFLVGSIHQLFILFIHCLCTRCSF